MVYRYTKRRPAVRGLSLLPPQNVDGVVSFVVSLASSPQFQEAQRQQRIRLGARELQSASVGSVGSAKGFTESRQRAESNSSSSSEHGGGSGPVGSVGSGGVDSAEANRGDETSEHSGEGVEDDGVSTVSRGSLLVGEQRPAAVTNRRTPAAVVPTGGSGGGGGGGEVLGEYKIGEGKDMLSDDSRHMESDDGDGDGLVGSSLLTSYSEGAIATAEGVRIGGIGGGAEGWARVRGMGARPRTYRHHYPRIQPIHASPRAVPTNLSQVNSAGDSGLGGMEYLISPGGTGVLNAFCSPLSEATAAAAGSEMTQAGTVFRQLLWLKRLRSSL